MLTVTNLSKEFQDEKQTTIAYAHVSFTVRPGEFFTIVGPSGCGKSTLMRTIARLTEPTRGTVTWDEKPRIGFVFQNDALFPFLTVRENIEFGLKMRGPLSVADNRLVHELIGEVGLHGEESRHPRELSGGMRQRVGIARSLAVSPNVLMLDEPFSSLDEFTAEDLRHLIQNIWKERSITVIMITHLIREALQLGDTIAVMSNQPGTIKNIVKNPLTRPRQLRSSSFFTLEDKIRNELGI